VSVTTTVSPESMIWSSTTLTGMVALA